MKEFPAYWLRPFLLLVSTIQGRRFVIIIWVSRTESLEFFHFKSRICLIRCVADILVGLYYEHIFCQQTDIQRVQTNCKKKKEAMKWKSKVVSVPTVSCAWELLGTGSWLHACPASQQPSLHCPALPVTQRSLPSPASQSPASSLAIVTASPSCLCQLQFSLPRPC